MHLAPSEEQTAFLAGLRRMVDECGGRELVRAAMQRDDGIATELWGALAEIGVFGLAVPEERGGQGAGWVDCCLALEVLAGALCEGPVLAHMLAIVLVDRHGDAQQRERWLPRWLNGDARATVMFDAAGTSVPFAAGADAVVAISRGRWWVIPTETPGVVVEPVAVLDPSWRCADVVVERAAWDAGRHLANATLRSIEIGKDMMLTALACCQAGLARACLTLSTEYAVQRRQFGRQIGSFQAVQHHCADMFVAVESARSIAWQAAWCCDNAQDELSVAAATAAQWCGEASFKVAGTAIQIHGGIGFTWEHDCHLLFKRAEVLRRLLPGDIVRGSRLRRAAGL